MKKNLLTILTFLFIFPFSILAQESFLLRGQYLLDKKVVTEAEITVYEGEEVIQKTTSDKLGKFRVALQIQKKYVMQFKKEGLPSQKVIVSTINKNLIGDLSKTKVLVFVLSAKKQSTEGPGIEDAVANYQINKMGLLEEKKVNLATTSAESTNSETKTMDSADHLKKTLKDLAIEEKSFLKREDVKKYRSQIERYEKKGNLSSRDSLDYQIIMLGLNEEMIKSARLQLAVDKLNAKTLEDSLAILEKEAIIFQAEQEILEAKNVIEIQKLEIEHKNTMLISMSLVAVLLLLVVIVLLLTLRRNRKNAKLLAERTELIEQLRGEVERKMGNKI